MFSGLAKSLFGDTNSREIKKLETQIAGVNGLETKFAALSDDALTGMTEVFRERLKAGETEDKILDEAFATVREAARRTLGQRHFDVQLMGGLVLHPVSYTHLTLPTKA